MIPLSRVPFDPEWLDHQDEDDQENDEPYDPNDEPDIDDEPPPDYGPPGSGAIITEYP